MAKILSGYSAQVYALMRIVVGLLFMCHGAQKLFGVFGGLNGTAAPLFSLMGFAGVIERFGGITGSGWISDRLRRLSCERSNGRGLLHGALSTRLLAYPQLRRTAGIVLLRLSLHGEQGFRNLERRFGAAQLLQPGHSVHADVIL